jgi:16S rRNA G527 N7-methylase RsmG
MKRRAGFLELQAATLGLDNVEVSPRRVEELPSDFDVAVARALTDPSDALPALLNLVVPGGSAIVASGPSATLLPGATLVRPGDSVAVDSPGVLFMMSRGS